MDCPRVALLALVVSACGAGVPPGTATPDASAADTPAAATDAEPSRAPWWGSAPAPHHSTLALTPDGRHLVVVRPDDDAVAIVDVTRADAVREIPLAPAPVLDRRGRYAPAVVPRAVSIAPTLGRAYVACEQSGEVVAIDLARGRVVARGPTCARTVSVLVSAGEDTVYASCVSDAAVVALDATTLRPVRRAAVPGDPWALGLSNDGTTLYVTHFLGARVTPLDARTLDPRPSLPVAAIPPRGFRTLAHGEPRGLADVAARPGTGELWVPHLLLATDTAQPELDFESTVFPAVSVPGSDRPTMTTDARIAGVDGAFRHVGSGPRAVAFLPGGATALVVNLNSENIYVVDAARGVERQLVEDLPGAMPDGVVVDPSGRRAFVNERNSGDVVALVLAADGTARIELPALPTRTRDPMPAALRTGQQVFYSANDRYGAFPITTNHWIACENCHLEGGTSAVTLRFAHGPRDTPSPRAGLDGFLLSTATRTSVRDFWRTINVEQGGQFLPDDEILGPYLAALTEYVTRALVAPPGPRTDPARVARGLALFTRPDVGCARCHQGERFTDSGAGNPSLDLAGSVRLHDVGTCVTGGPYPDRAHADILGNPRGACAFDTPTLRSVSSSAPYLHDGRAATLRDVLTITNVDDRHGRTSGLRPGEIDDLVEFLRSL